VRLAVVCCAWAVLAAWTIRPAPAAPAVAPSPVADAAMRGELARVRQLIQQGADVNAAQGDGMTALHWAAEHGDSAMTAVLLKAGAKTTAVTRNGSYTPLHVAGRNGHAAVVRALVKAGAAPDARSASGATALHLASASASADAVTALLDAGADPNAREAEWGQTPLIFAASANRAAVVRVLLKRGANPSLVTRTVDLTERTAQEQAATRRRNEVMLELLPQAVRDSLYLAAGMVPPRPVGDRSPPPISMRSLGFGTLTIDSAALAGAGGGGGGGGRGGGVQAPTHLLTPAQIQQAVEAGRQALLAPPRGPAQEEADTADGQVAGYAGTVGKMGGLSALHHAARDGNLAAVEALLDGGADINQRSANDSTTPLLMATISGQFDVAMRLVKRGANVKLASLAGTTPLYSALNTQWSPKSRFPQPQAVQNQETGYLELMEAILKAGADVNVRLKQNLWYFGYNNCGNGNCGLEYLDGTTPFWRAAYAVDVEAMRLLIKHGADPTVPSYREPAGGGRGRGGFGGGGGRGAGPALDPEIDSAMRAVPPGIGVYAVHCAAGVGYGNGFAGNSHRHAPDGWMPAMRYLVEELHADVNARDNNGNTPLHHAAARGDNEMILYLVSKGADVKAVNRRGQTTVDMANGPVQRLRPFPETIALLEKLGAKNSHRCVGC
jgi:ankyrin repeat protein